MLTERLVRVSYKIVFNFCSIAWIFALLVAAWPAHAEEPPTWLVKSLRALSPEMRQVESRIAEIEAEMAKLPVAADQVWGSRYGHRSADLPSGDVPDWFQLDMGVERRIDTIVLIPAFLSFQGEDGVGYGFPKRFRIEFADNPEMENAVVLVDRSAKDVRNPGRDPLVFKVEPTKGQYLRFTSLRHVHEDGKFYWALEELMVMEGNRNVARNAVQSMSSRQDLFPMWAPVRLVDGQHSQGLPVDVTRVSPSLGYLSARMEYDAHQGGQLPEGEELWCAVDLKEKHVIEEIAVLPIESDEYLVFGGRGFPRMFRVELSNDPEFKELIWDDLRGAYPLGYPNRCSISFTVPRIEARYVRVVVLRMWSRDDQQVFGLSEIQVYDAEKNIALGKPVSVKTQAEVSPDSGWAPEYLVDGYSSRYRLIEWPEYLNMLDRRGELRLELMGLRGKRADKLEFASKAAVSLGTISGILLVLGLMWFWVSQRRLRNQAVEQLRRQIARDLHDDIGSNLGGIVLLSEIGTKQSGDGDSRKDFGTIRDAAQEASDSMRDIVWLVQRQESGLRDMLMRMRESAAMILRDIVVDFHVDPASFKERELGLLFRRHFFFAYKEALNNIRKHAEAEAVSVSVLISRLTMRFEVKDDGAGFEPSNVKNGGCGLRNLEQRARRLGGQFEIKSEVGKGTTIIFEAPFKN